jgi:hypothetical protein
MKDVYNVSYQITDRGVEFPVKEEEVVISKGKTVLDSLKTQLNKYRHAMNLSTKFTVKIVSQYHSGWSN